MMDRSMAFANGLCMGNPFKDIGFSSLNSIGQVHAVG